jgi:hypothetical protein
MFPSIGCIGSREVPLTNSVLLMEGRLRPYQYCQQVLLEVPVLTSDNLVDLHTRAPFELKWFEQDNTSIEAD